MWKQKHEGDPLQHDHHCWVTFMDRNWRIYEVRRHLLFVQRNIGYGHCFVIETIDISKVDFETYCETAVAWDYADTESFH